MVYEEKETPGTSRQAEEAFLEQTLSVILANLGNYGQDVSRLRAQIDEMLEHFHDDNPELINLLENTMTLHEHMKRALERNEKALNKPYFGRIVFYDETLGREESLYIGKGGISKDATTQVVIDWRAPVANTYYENGLGKCSYTAPGDRQVNIDLKLKRTYEIEQGKLVDYFDSEIIANDDLLTKYLAKNKQAVLGEIVATIQKEQNDIIRKSPYHNIIVQGVAGSGKTTVAMHRISFILYNYQDRFKPDDFYIVGSNRILLNYITGVLPDLDVYGVRQMTMEELFVRLLYEDWDEKKYSIRKNTQGGNRGSIKGGAEWFRDLQAYCDKMEWEKILRESIYLNPKQFVEGLRDGKNGVYDETTGKEISPDDLVLLVEGEAVERYIRQNPKVSMQSKINMLNERLIIKIKEEFLGKGVKYTESERKAILRAYRGRYGGNNWKGSIYKLYREFLDQQIAKGKAVDIPDKEFDVYDLAALAYIYKRIKETEVISEAHHIVIDEAQDFGMMAYSVLHFCIQACTYTVMGDVSQNIHFGFGLNDWEELKALLLPDEMDSFGILKKSYRNTVEISDFAARILRHGQFPSYTAEPIIRHGDPVKVKECTDKQSLFVEAADVCRKWQSKGFETIAVVCRNQDSADRAAEELGKYVEVMESDLEKAVFGSGIMVFPVEYTKGLEFDTVLILDPAREEYPVDDGHAKLLYVAATRALHELCVLHTGNLTGLIADPLPETAQTDCSKPNALPHCKVLAEEDSFADSPGRENEPAQKTTPGTASGSDRASGKTVQRKRVSIALNTQSDAGSTRKQTAESDSSLIKRFSAQSQKQAVDLQNKPTPSLPGNDRQQEPQPVFGDIPATGKLRPIGHSKADLSIKWITKQPDGLYLQSRYGILRLSPVGSAIIRVTFTRNGQPDSAPAPGIAVQRTEKFWMYKDAGRVVELTTDELILRVDKSTGAIQYYSRDKKLLLAEQARECRLLEGTPGKMQGWLFLDWAKEEHLYSFGSEEKAGISLRGTARYISHGYGNRDASQIKDFPFLLSDKGYGILMATDSPAFCCDIRTYGSYLYTENQKQMDFYFIAGKRQDTILNAYSYLCGKM